MKKNFQMAPELSVTHWLNSKPLTLKKLRGKVVLIEAFQMLCPGCVSHGLPQAQRVSVTFDLKSVFVIGLHTVFEHHEAQGSITALTAFLHEYQIKFPVAIDAQRPNQLSQTMSDYGMQGTPSLILIDKKGYIRKHQFGLVEDLVLGAEIQALLNEKIAETAGENTSSP